MNKLVRIFTLLLCLTLLLGSVPLALAQESQQVLQIHTVEDFLRFAQDCRLDTYSQGLTVELNRDIDLTGTDFAGIPTFSGILDGKGWRIKGLKLDHNGSNVGLIRYLTQGAVVRNLHVEGSVTPGGSAAAVGGIAGESAGLIENSGFTGTVSGVQKVGGLVGVQRLSGMIRNCTVSGSVHGTHFVGGLVGENAGVIRECENTANINTVLEQNKVSLEDITLDTLTGSESAAAITDIGGIAGNGSGVIRDCVNRGDVGYPQIGYNIGGIVGSTNGYVTDCANHGVIHGRKEVGGIAGQLEPAMRMLFSQDALQTLQQQMGGMAGAAGALGSHAQSGAAALRSQAQKLDQEAQNAKDALSMLAPSKEFPFVPDLDTVQASKNALASSMTGMNDSIHAMASISKDTMGLLSSDIQNLAGQLAAIGGTVSTASQNLGGSVTDVSDLDTAEDLTAKIALCVNQGAVQGDWNVGGIVGAIAIENDLDPESDLTLFGDYSLNFDMELRSVILDCRSTAPVTGKKQNVGGIVGWMTMGLAKGCVNMAQVEAAAADYVGGIAGKAQGAIRLCAHRGAVSGSTYVGGIAGTAQAITDCAALVALTNPSECFGGILGSGDTALLSGNHYLSAGADPGGVDGISYDGIAQALEAAAFFALENVPQEYSSVTLRFVLDENTTKTLVLPYGTRLESSHFPTLPDKSGTESAWEGTLHPGDPVHFDSVIRAVYTSRQYTLESALVDRLGRPLLLAQGDFLPEARVELEKLDTEAIEAWTLELPHSDTSLKLRYLLPKDHGADAVALEGLVEEQWIPLDFTAQGSYLVFTAPEGLRAIRLNAVEPEPSPYLLPAILGGAVLLTVLVVVLAVRRKKKKSAPQPDPQTPALP